MNKGLGPRVDSSRTGHHLVCGSFAPARNFRQHRENDLLLVSVIYGFSAQNSSLFNNGKKALRLYKQRDFHLNFTREGTILGAVGNSRGLHEFGAYAPHCRSSRGRPKYSRRRVGYPFSESRGIA